MVLEQYSTLATRSVVHRTIELPVDWLDFATHLQDRLGRYNEATLTAASNMIEFQAAVDDMRKAEPFSIYASYDHGHLLNLVDGRPPKAKQTEHSREKDVYKYLHAWASLHRPVALYRHAFPHHDAALPKPEPCVDTALTAFAQLCTLRLQARRCLITLISGGVEYVLSEATRSMSLQYETYDDNNDAPWLGCCSFPRSDGINDLGADAWRKARRYRDLPEDHEHYYREGGSAHWLIVSDARNDRKYCDRAFVKRGLNLRFFCSVPLRDAQGSVIGALSVMDDKPRYGVSAAEMRFLEDSADTITSHLDATVVRSKQQSSEQLIKALGLFNNRKSSLREWWVGQDNERLRKTGRYHDPAERASDQQERENQEFGVQNGSDLSDASQRRTRREAVAESQKNEAASPSTSSATSTNMDATNAREQQDVAMTDFDPRPVQAEEDQSEVDVKIPADAEDNGNQAQRVEATKKRKKMKSDSFDLARKIEDVYARASNLINEAMRAEGVIFVDARAASATMRGKHKRLPGSSDGLSTTEHSSGNQSDAAANSLSEDNASGEAAKSTKLCTINGFATRRRSTLAGSRASSSGQLNLSEVALRGLIKRYPNGKIFNFADSGGVYSSSGEEPPTTGSSEDGDSQQTGSFSSHRSRASRDAARLGKIMSGAKTIAFLPIWDDVSETFNSSVFVWSTTPQRFFDSTDDITYIAAFSHSLTAELTRLETIASDKAKGTFISSISHELRSPLHGVLAGAELLQETELTRFQREMASTITMAGRTLLDTVVETTVSAHRFARQSTSSASDDDGSVTPGLSSTASSMGQDCETAVTLDISNQHTWLTDLSRGSWTRIIGNLLGNALKYTKSGVVAVTLSARECRSDSASIELVVQDSGIGMTPQFLAGDMFTPFKQADPNTTGTGLGLSIVKQIAKGLGARLNVQSELGKGTRISVTLDINLRPASGDVDGDDQQLLDAASTMELRRLHILDLNVDLPRVKAVRLSAAKTASDWLRCAISNGPRCDSSLQAGACVLVENELIQLAKSQPDTAAAIISELSSQDLQLILMASNFQSTSSDILFEDFPVEPIFIHQPFGPRKLLRAITARKSNMTARITRSASSYTTTPSPSATLVMNGDGLMQAKHDSFPWRSNGEENKARGGQSKTVRANTSDPTDVSSLQMQEPTTVQLNSGSGRSNAGSTDTHVLLVDDNPINLQLLMALMKKLQTPFDTAVNGAEALDLFSKNPSRYFLVLTDISMPVMDGNQAAAKMREVENKHKKLPRTTIVAISGVTSAASRKVSQDSGIDRYITKPAGMKDVRALIAEVKTM
ncbi:hypothetical protein LTR49_006475 [Elasticomyces elasticus]|nr:hypothetical protein LTR49_006475 [Elasticomyces elasticus]